ncbi:MAG: UV DNA damage repair endonuclease UvsE [Candidatus Woesearchaeota archaeon]
MKIGYACINTQIGCSTNSTFRLKNFTKENFIEKVSNNLSCLKEILKFNLKNNLLFYRISSAIIPFASHEVCKIDWVKYFKKDFKEIGKFINENKLRVSMHPDQFVIINAKDENIVKKSIAELKYHCDFLDALNVDESCKVQIHIGGVYGDKTSAIKRFIENYKKLPNKIKKRLVIENDHRSYSLKDCLIVNKATNIPLVYDSYHHECLNNGETFKESISKAIKTWQKKDGNLMVDYSNEGDKKGNHSKHIDLKKFKEFLKETKQFDFDITLEVKDKEKSALEAIKCLK